MASGNGHRNGGHQAYPYPQFDPSQRQQTPSGFNSPQLENPQLQVSHMSDARMSKLEGHHDTARDQTQRMMSPNARVEPPDAGAGASGQQRDSIARTPEGMQSPASPPAQNTRSDNTHAPNVPAPESSHYVTPAGAISSPDRTTSPYRVPPPTEYHPAMSAPYADDESVFPRRASQPASSKADEKRDRGSHGSEKVSGGAGLTPAIPLGSLQQTEPKLGGASERGEIRPDLEARTSRVPTYNPDSVMGPDQVGPGAHQPGQAMHPTMTSRSPEWDHSLCECGDLSTCCQGFWCPCVLYGKIQYRVNRRTAGKDPTDLLGYKAINGACGLITVACGAQWLLTLLQHSRIRAMYDLEGSVARDCIPSYCCYSCMLMQDEREMRDREANLRSTTGPTSRDAAAYVSPPEMTYAPQ